MPTDQHVRSISRAAGLLALFDGVHPFLSLQELVERSGLPKSTVVRLVANLEELAFLARRPDGRLSLGAGLLQWVRVADSLWEVNHSTRRVMRQLVDAIGESVNVYVRQGTSRTAIAQEEGIHTVRNVVERGKPFTLAGGAAATVLLAGAPHLAADVAAAAGVEPEILAERIRAFDSDGYVVSVGERELGASAVAAAIRNDRGRVVAALSISGPTSRFTGQLLDDAIRAVVAGAATITSAGLGSVEALL